MTSIHSASILSTHSGSAGVAAAAAAAAAGGNVPVALGLVTEVRKTPYANEILLELLHAEIVKQFIRSSPESDWEVVFHKMETIGYRVGQSLSERYSKDKPRFTTNLDIVKFICKDFWIAVFKKQVDNLKTNHKGIFVLQDDKFRWFTRMSTDGSSDTVRKAAPYLAFPCGLIRGALANLGVSSTVTAEISILPICTFQIKFQ